MSYTKAESDIIIADSLKELNYKQKKLLLASLNQSNKDRDKYADALIKICGVGLYNKVKSLFLDEKYRGGVLKDLHDRRVECSTVKSGDYPELLRHIPVPPLVLYMRGNCSLLSQTLFGVVGSRKTLSTANAECEKICSALSKKLVVVTGVADGADSAAVRGALPSGNIICVLPCGHDAPSTGNPRCVKEVERVGLTISEFTPQTPAQRYTFLLRNRIIAGLCSGVLVVSAGIKSGALNTANYSADYSRDVFAFPYSLGIPSGEGCNALIKKGASLCENADDILSSLGLESAVEEVVELEPDEEQILNLLKNDGELHVEKIAAALNKKLFEINALCASLEIKGMVVKTGGNKYAAI